MRNQRASEFIDRREVAHEIAHRQRRVTIEVFTADTFVDPGAGALTGAYVQVSVEAANESANNTCDAAEAIVLSAHYDPLVAR